MALLAPSNFLEPFCGVSAEAQLCGTPVIGPDAGAIVENVENFKTGLRCHTLSDYQYGIQMALDSRYDRAYIRERAVRLFDMYNIAKKYEHAFKSILDIYNGTNGWYSPNTHIQCMND
jgi:glycosyltransferase involved in cell wall biosynthesis